MARFTNVAAEGQLGPIARSETRTEVVARLMALMRQAHANGCDLIVYPELALTTFFPRWYMEDQAEIDAFFEREMPGQETRPLFDLARELGIGFCLGYAELTIENGETLSVQHIRSRRQERRNYFQVPQGAFAGPR